METILWLCLLLTVVLVAGFCFAVRFDRRRMAKDSHRVVQEARDKILADGKVEGPKGPYVRHKKWDVGLGMATPRETKPQKGPGYHGTPLP